MLTKNIEYRFTLADGVIECFTIAVSPDNESEGIKTDNDPPAWTQLTFSQCPNCLLAPETHPRCPLAMSLVTIVRRFSNILSYESVMLEVRTDERIIAQPTTAQRAVSSLMGLVIANCGCPHTVFFKPMAWFHLPLATEEETVYRACSTYLLAQFFQKRAGGPAEFGLEGLRKIYQNMQVVNAAIAERLRAASSADSSVNALIKLDIYAQTLSYVIEESLDDISGLFGPCLNPLV